MSSFFSRSGVSPDHPLGDIGKSSGVYPLHQVDQGRLFFRNLPEGKACAVGVVHLTGTELLGRKPAEWPMECLMPARLNSHLWVDLQRAQPFDRQLHWREEVGECDVGHLLTALQWRASMLDDGLHIALRACPIKDGRPGQWVIAFSAMNKRLPGFGQDGLYEISGQGPVLIDQRTHHGKSINQALELPVWGPHGDIGLLTSMRMDVYPEWVVGNRQQNAKSDPRYAQFLELIKDVPPLPMTYTRKQLEEHERDVSSVIQAMLARDLLSEITANRSARRAPQ